MLDSELSGYERSNQIARVDDWESVFLQASSMPRALSAMSSDFWSSIPGTELLHGEGNVEHRLVLPLLHALGYEASDIAAKYPVTFQEGRLGRKPEPDFVCFYGPLRDRTNSLLVVEVKQPGEPLPPGKSQGESYAQNLRAPLLLLTNGEVLEIWQMQITLESQRILSIAVSSLAAERGIVEKLLNKVAIREYCKSLQFKTILEATSDFGDYETAELERIARLEPAITRTLRVDTDGKTMESTTLLGAFSRGAIVTAPSGYGKTTLARNVVQTAIEERWRQNRRMLSFDVPLPDLEQSDKTLIAFMVQRLSAHHPGITEPSFKTTLRTEGATVVCDSFDRVSPEFQKRLAAECTNLLRDYPLVQLFIFSRFALKPELPLPWLILEALSTKQVRELESVVLNDGGTQNFSIVGMMSPTLRSLCVNPLLLRLALDYWKKRRDFPNKIELLFRYWLDAILDMDALDAASRVIRENALSILATKTALAPISGADALASLNAEAIPSDIFNQLVRCDAIRVSGGAVELQHEGLADFLRARALAAKPKSDLANELPTLPIPRDSFFPVLLMAQLPDRGLQTILWKRLSAGHISVYFDALRYRFDTSDQLRTLDPDKLSEDYLEDLVSGIDVPLLGFFPEMRASVIGQITDVRGPDLAATGRLVKSAGALQFKLHAREPGQARVLVGTPTFPGVIRGVDLNLSRYRIDSARLLGMNLVRNHLEQAIKRLDVQGGVEWAAERLIGRVRYLISKYDFDLKLADDLTKLEDRFAPLRGRWINDGFLGGEKFSFDSLLEDIATLRSAGRTALDPWWTRLGWYDDAWLKDEDVYRNVLDEEYRRIQLIYAEIVQASFQGVASELIYYPTLPIRWKLTVVRRDRGKGPSTIYFHWVPVASWDDAGADVSFSESGPIVVPDWQMAQKELAILGRPSHVPMYGGWTLHYPYDGHQWDGYFNGATPVTSQVGRWLKHDMDTIFEGLPHSDGSF